MDKIKIEIDLLRDSLRNLFVVMFAIMSGEISLFYKLIQKVNYFDLAMFSLGILILFIILKIKKIKKAEIDNLLKKMEA